MIFSFHILMAVGSEHAIPILINHLNQRDLTVYMRLLKEGLMPAKVNHI